jgi:hypothetical protein
LYLTAALVSIGWLLSSADWLLGFFLKKSFRLCDVV